MKVPNNSTFRAADMEAVVPVWLQILLTGLVGVLVWQAARFWVERKRFPPGPLPWPILGNLPQLGTLPHQTLAKLAQTYGPLMLLRMGSKPALVISSPRLAEEVLKTQDLVWSERSNCVVGDIMFYGSRDMLFGPKWKLQRTVMTQELLTGKRVADFKKARQEEILKGIRQAIAESGGDKNPVKIGAVIRTWSLNIVMRMLMNEGPTDDSYEMTESFVETLRECIKLMGQAQLDDCLPWLAPFDILGHKKQMRTIAKQLDGFFSNVLEDHRQKLRDGQKIHDVVAAMLMSKVDGQNALEDSEMKGIMQDFILAGTDTTTGSIEWALSELMRNPSAMDKVRAEMDSVVGKERLVDESDLPRLPYLGAVVKEALRLHPIGPFLVPHAAKESCEVDGYRLPAGTQLFVNVYAIQRDPKVWERALEFDPDRFLDSQKDVHGRHFELLPFGSGRRICPGKNLGMVIIQYSLALMIQTCHLHLPGYVKPQELDMEEKFGLAVSRLNPLEVVVASRLGDHLIQNSL